MPEQSTLEAYREIQRMRKTHGRIRSGVFVVILIAVVWLVASLYNQFTGFDRDVFQQEMTAHMEELRPQISDVFAQAYRNNETAMRSGIRQALAEQAPLLQEEINEQWSVFTTTFPARAQTRLEETLQQNMEQFTSRLRTMYPDLDDKLDAEALVEEIWAGLVAETHDLTEAEMNTIGESLARMEAVTTTPAVEREIERLQSQPDLGEMTISAFLKVLDHNFADPVVADTGSEIEIDNQIGAGE